MAIESEGTIGRRNAATLPLVAKPMSLLGAPFWVGLMLDMGYMLTLVALSLLGVVSMIWIIGIVPAHVLGIAIGSRSVHVDELAQAWLGGRRGPRPRKAALERNPGARVVLEA